MSTLADSFELQLGIKRYLTTTSIGGVTWTWVRRQAVEGVAIRWGRDSILDSPKQRTATITILEDRNFSMREMLDTLPNQMLRLKLNKLSYPVIFEGIIDTIKPFIHGSKQGITVSATESFFTSFSDTRLSTIAEPSDGNPFLRAVSPNYAMTWLTTMRNYVPASTFLRTWPSGSSYFPQPEAQKLTVKQIIEAVAAWHPLTYPSWSPDHKQIRSTWAGDFVFGLQPLHQIIDVPAAKVIVSDDVEIDVRTYPKSWTYQQGSAPIGSVSEPEFYRQSWPRGQTNVVSDHLLNFNPDYVTGWINDVIKPGVDALKAQVTSPRKFRFSHNLIGKTDDVFWFPWERNVQQIRITKEPYAELMGIDPVFVPIGGTLKITAADVTHDVHCAWARNRPATNARKTWGQLTSLWSRYTQDWSEFTL